MASANANAVWWKDGLNFSCTRCGACCGREPGTVRFTRLELSAMSRLLCVSEEKFKENYTWRKYGTLSLKERRNYDCVFLCIDDCGAKCDIYSERPRQCVSFPFWPEILENKDAWKRYSDSCPGMNAGKFFSYDEISVIVVEYIHDGISKFL
ncbi:MAG: YkgJ family cysteine cluster protein [Synergistaceae bacterium]|jgi:Fe-S-cluster containining protein|nr:YkgJ family cysteine cluster protein [Synergistaceae bacterium]